MKLGYMIRVRLSFLCFLCLLNSTAQKSRIKSYGNPIIPDITADPSICEVDGTFYCYATTDGYNNGLASSGPPVVWKSKDLINWSFNSIFFPSANGQIYWAPSTVTKKNGRYYLYPTINRNIYAAVADSPEGPFHLANGADTFTGPNAAKPIVLLNAPKNTKGIDAEVFVDDDGKAYMFWAQRGAALLMNDMVTLDTAVTVISTKRSGYSEGPFLFKRNGIYYYLYTLEGHENYKYAYVYSKVSPLGPFIFPENDIIAVTDRARRIYGPGHGSVFSEKGTDHYYFAYLEFGNGSTNRQVWVDKMEFNSDGTIKPVVLTREGVSITRSVKPKINLTLGKRASASGYLPDLKVKPIKDSTFQRTETYNPANAVDGSNGTRWLGLEADSTNWFIVDLGAPKNISRTEAYFVKPTAGHSYKLEYSLNGNSWKVCGGHNDIKIQSPHVDRLSVKARYIRLTVLQGIPGLWEFKVF